MDYLLAGIGLALAAAGIAAVSFPRQLGEKLLSWDSHRLFLAGVASRVGIGIVCMQAAPLTRYPMTIYVLGCLSIAGALVLAILGPKRLEELLRWWIERPAAALRVGYLITVGFGTFLLYAAL